MTGTTTAALKQANSTLARKLRCAELDAKAWKRRAQDAERERGIWKAATQAIQEERDRRDLALRRILRDRREADKVYAYCVDALGPNVATQVLGGATLREQRASTLDEERTP